MEVLFNNKKLQQLYENGKSKQYPLDKKVIESFFIVIAALESAKDIHDLWNLPSLNFKKLQGYKDRYSLRLNIKYRLEISIDWTNDEYTIGIIALEEISNHYGG